MRRSQQPAFANPVLIGAVTVLVAIIAVFLAYNANNGLPFVPTRQLKVDIASGASLVPGNDVEEGGYRIGIVSDMHPIELPNGTVGAQLVLQLNTVNGRVPVDSTATVRPRSLLGLKYVDLNFGRSKRLFADGATMPISQTSVPVQFDDINAMFDAKTRPAIERNLAGYGDALTARGSALNDTIASLPSLFQHLQPVARYLSDPHTELTRFFQALNGFFGTVSPVAQTNERLFADQATTFQAISRSASDLKNTIRESPPTLDVSTSSLKAQQPFLGDLTTFANYFAPATAQLRDALPNIDPALAAGVKVLPRTPSMNQKLQSVLRALNSLALDPGTNVALNGLKATTGTLNPMLRYLGPYVTVCNQWNYFWVEIADLVSERTNFGMAQRALLQFANHETNNVGSQGATQPANGYDQSNPADVAAAQQTGGTDAEYLHAPAYAAAIDNRGNADCEVGQRGYLNNANYFDPSHRQLVTNQYTPGDQGTTWAGLSRVPPGETYSRTPVTGPQLPIVPGGELMRRIRKRRISSFVAGVIGIIVILAFSYGAYTKFSNPFANPYTVHAIFANANGLKPDSLVRIAGVNVGKVQSVSPVSGCRLRVSSGPQQPCSAADVTMTIDNSGLPIHKDATFWIRPRIFLEGNFFVDVNPGTPEAPVAPSGYVFSIQQGTEPVQFDQLLTSLQNDTRSNLQILLQEYGQAVTQGGPAYNASIQYWTPAYKYGGEVSHDTLGTQPHDLSGWIDKGGVVNGALSAHPQNLKSLITDFNTTALAFARQNVALSNAVAELPRTLGVAIPALNALNNAFPPLRAFARTLVPGVQSTGPMVDASLPFFTQLHLLVSPSELEGLTNDLSGTIPALAKLNAESIPFMKNEVRPAASCQMKVILPWTRLTVPDQNFNASNGVTPRPVYVEGVDFLPGLAGESRSFDANGPYVRVLLTGGTTTYSLSPGMFGTALAPIMGTQPEMPALHSSGDGAKVPVSRPPLKPNVPCETQQPITDLSAPSGAAPQPVSTGASAPGATLRRESAGLLALAQLEQQAKQQGLGFRFTSKIARGK